MIEKLRAQIPAGMAEEFSSPELTLCADSSPVSVPPPCYSQWHVEDPGNSAKSADGRLHLTTYTPLIQRSRSVLTMPLSRHSMGTCPGTSSHARKIRP